MLGGQKRGVRPNPLEPPLCTGLIMYPTYSFVHEAGQWVQAGIITMVERVGV